MKSFLVLLAIGAVMVVLGRQAYLLFREKNDLTEKLHMLEARALHAQDGLKKAQADVNYFSKERNMEKEIKSVLPYAFPDEELFVIIPKK